MKLISHAMVTAVLLAASVLSAPVAVGETLPPLQLKVFMASEDHMALGVSSAIIYGEKEAVLVDAQFTLSNAHRLVAEILETGRELTTIYITHEHPDHFMGLPVVIQAFPDAKVVSIKVSADDVNNSFDFKLEYWGNKVLGVNGAKSKVFVETLKEPLIMLEGRRLEILGPFQGDAPNSSVVWVPSIKTLIASDLIYDHTHAWMAAGKTPELRQQWLDALDQLEALKPDVVVPGHAPSNEYLSPASINYTRQYIKAYIKAMAETENSQELRAEMNRIYPDAGMQFALEYGSKILKDGWIWDGQWPESLRNMKPR
jgi:glyoxylase-like metal-dependent hydrolase (beta-lactamase superfamily II)